MRFRAAGRKTKPLVREVGRGGIEPPTLRFSGGCSYRLSYLPPARPTRAAPAVPTGFEPATSALTGRRELLASPRDLAVFAPLAVPSAVMPSNRPCCACPQRDSNPCYRLERATSWAARRWGRYVRRPDNWRQPTDAHPWRLPSGTLSLIHI